MALICFIRWLVYRCDFMSSIFFLSLYHSMYVYIDCNSMRVHESVWVFRVFVSIKTRIHVSACCVFSFAWMAACRCWNFGAFHTNTHRWTHTQHAFDVVVVSLVQRYRHLGWPHIHARAQLTHLHIRHCWTFSHIYPYTCSHIDTRTQSVIQTKTHCTKN